MPLFCNTHKAPSIIHSNMNCWHKSVHVQTINLLPINVTNHKFLWQKKYNWHIKDNLRWHRAMPIHRVVRNNWHCERKMSSIIWQCAVKYVQTVKYKCKWKFMYHHFRKLIEMLNSNVRCHYIECVSHTEPHCVLKT